MRSWYALTCVAVELLTASFAAGQARVDRVIKGPDGVTAQRAGSSKTERDIAQLTYQPGDQLSASDTSAIELTCLPKESTKYRLKGPFRVLIDVPVGTLCHVNLLAGQGEVLAEEPTNTTAAGINLRSKGTQFSVSVTRVDDRVVRKVVVFDGE